MSQTHMELAEYQEPQLSLNNNNNNNNNHSNDLILTF